MNLSLSVRIAEAFHEKTKSSMTVAELAGVARRIGFDALCMRASQVGVHSTPDRVDEVKAAIGAAGLSVSMVTGDFAVPENSDRGPDNLRDFSSQLDLCEALGANLIRVCMKREGDIPFAQRAADEARERGIRIAHQSHFASLFETVDGSIDVLRAVGRDNFGLIYEPANWMVCGQDYVQAIERVRPWIFNVYVQNHLVRSGGVDALETWTQGRVELDHIGIWERGGVDGEAVFEALRSVDYDGYVTVHQAFGGIMTPVDAAERSFAYLTSLV